MTTLDRLNYLIMYRPPGAGRSRDAPFVYYDGRGNPLVPSTLPRTVRPHGRATTETPRVGSRISGDGIAGWVWAAARSWRAAPAGSLRCDRRATERTGL